MSVIKEFENSNPYEFKVETYNGISIVRETTTNYINASKMCSDNGKKWRSYKQTNQWKEIEKHALKYIKFDDVGGPSNLGRTQFDIINADNNYKGTYIHPKLIHFVAEYVSIEYAFKVAELMDSVNNRVHQQLQQLQLPDTPTNAKPIFEQTINNNIRFVSEDENKQCWGVRETDKFDYLDSWDKSYIRDQYNKFKEAINKINISINELKVDYPQLFE